MIGIKRVGNVCLKNVGVNGYECVGYLKFERHIKLGKWISSFKLLLWDVLLLLIERQLK